MKKVININGMSCEHCKARVEKALNSLNGVSAKVDLKKKTAVVYSKSDINDETIKSAVEELGFEVESISEKKGLCGIYF